MLPYNLLNRLSSSIELVLLRNLLILLMELWNLIVLHLHNSSLGDRGRTFKASFSNLATHWSQKRGGFRMQFSVRLVCVQGLGFGIHKTREGLGNFDTMFYVQQLDCREVKFGRTALLL